MLYYLSYVESHHGAHASLMLSAQDNLASHPQIMYEAGFRLSPNLDQNNVSYFHSYKGQLREERITSKILYGNFEGYHRTYPISEEEMYKFFNIMKRDMQLNPEEVTYEAGDGKNKKIKKITQVSGPNYQILSLNCKTYALGVLKEIGIIEASTLSNFLIQRPGTTNSALEEMERKNLECPLKDTFMKKINKVSNKIINNIKEFPSTESFKLKNKNLSLNEFFKLTSETSKLATELMLSARDVGIEPEFTENFKTFLNLLNKIDEYSKYIEVKEKDQKAVNKIFQELSEAKTAALLLEKTANEINALSKTHELPFFWSELPTVSKRLCLDNFSDEEKMIYGAKIYGNEAKDGLNELVDLITKEIENRPDKKDDYVLDLKQLRKYINQSITEIEASNEAFKTAVKKNSFNKCAKHRNNIDNALLKLENNVANFVPKTEDSINGFIKLINRIIAFFRKDYFGFGHSIKNPFDREIRTIKDKTQIHFDFFKKEKEKNPPDATYLAQEKNQNTYT